MGVVGFNVRLTAFPVEGVSETPVRVTLKERIEAPAGGASLMVRLKVELPPGGGGPDFDWPLQEASEMEATKSMEREAFLRNIRYPT